MSDRAQDQSNNHTEGWAYLICIVLFLLFVLLTIACIIQVIQIGQERLS